MLTSCCVAVWWLALLIFHRKVTRFETDSHDGFLSFSFLSVIAVLGLNV
jgi:hypothetical protein